MSQFTDSREVLTVFPWIPICRTTEQFTIDIPGVRREADGTCCSTWLQVIGFEPYYYFELDPNRMWTEGAVLNIVNELKVMFRQCAPTRGRLVWKERLQEYEPERKIPLLEIEFRDRGYINYFRKVIKDEKIKMRFGLTGAVLEDDLSAELKMHTLRRAAFSSWFTCKAGLVPEEEWVSYGKTSLPDGSVFGNPNHREYRVDWKTIEGIPIETSKLWRVQASLMSFDIEAFSEDDMRMPCAYYINEPAHLNTCIFQELGRPESQKIHVIALLPVDEIKGAEVHVAGNEVKMGDVMAELIQRYQPDIITGYNIAGFDFEYLQIRRQLYMGKPDWPMIGRLKDEDHSVLQEISWASSGAGDIKGHQFRMTGRLIIDLYLYILRHFKLAEYNLGAVSAKFLKGKTKHPITPQEQFKIYREYRNIIALVSQHYQAGTAPSREEYEELMRCKREYTRLAEYCVQDAKLVVELFELHSVFANLLAKSEVSCVPINYILEKGETIKSTSMLYSLAHHDGFVMTPIEKQNYDYEGGLVQNPIPGFHPNIVTEDFSSMYPSIMMAENGCPTTLLPERAVVQKKGETEDEARVRHRLHEHLLNYWGRAIALWKEQKAQEATLVAAQKAKKGQVKAESFGRKLRPKKEEKLEGGPPNMPSNEEIMAAFRPQIEAEIAELRQRPLYKEEDVNITPVPQKYGAPPLLARFVKAHLREGLAPRKEKQLLAARAVFKKLLKKWEDPVTGVSTVPDVDKMDYAKYNAMQNAIKIAANALYGFFGAPFNKYACIILAMMITARGRGLAEFCVAKIKEWFPQAIIVYGDTDSLMVDLGLTDGKQCHVVGKELSERLTALFPPPLAIAYEKSGNFLLLKKKHYAYFPLGKDGLPMVDQMTAKGIIIARRDYCNWVQDVYRQLLKMILVGRPLLDCMRIVITELVRLAEGQVPVEKLALIRKFTSGAGDKYFLKQFVDRKRRPPHNRTISVGDRVKYVFLVTPDQPDPKNPGKLKKASAWQMMEMFDEYDPRKGHQLDLAYYIDHQFRKPIDDLIGTAYVKEFQQYPLNAISYSKKGVRGQDLKPVAFDHPVKMMYNMLLDRRVDIRALLSILENPPAPPPVAHGTQVLS